MVEDEGPVRHAASQAVVGGEEERGAVLRRVVDEGAGADGEAALDDEGHGALLALPRRPFWTIDVDVAVAAVAVRAAGFTEHFGFERRLARNVAVGVHHLVNAQGAASSRPTGTCSSTTKACPATRPVANPPQSLWLRWSNPPMNSMCSRFQRKTLAPLGMWNSENRTLRGEGVLGLDDRAPNGYAV